MDFVQNTVYLSEAPPCQRERPYYSFTGAHEDFSRPLEEKARHCTHFKQAL